MPHIFISNLIQIEYNTIMNEKALKTLEFYKIRDRLTALAGSSAGKALCASLTPLTDLDEIETRQTETADALSRLFKNGRLSFGSTYDVRPQIKRLEIGSFLGTVELLQIAKLLQNTALVKTYGSQKKEEAPDDSLDGYFRALDPVRPLYDSITRAIISEDEISDHASSELARIRRSIRLSGDRIHTELNKILNSPARDYLQDALITTRNGRYCVPVRAGSQNHVPGIVHDTSSTGSTVFVEPASVVKLNNEIRELEAAEKAEIERILIALSGEAAEHTGTLAVNVETMTQLDFIFARAQLAMDMNATRPLFNDEGILDLKKARHPLLDKKKVVPIDISLGESFDMLIITGPNTGGKTVSLKTTGLLLIMGLCGLHIPAADRSRLGIYREIYADIGDEQSIEQSLSTFSAHMTNIVSFLEKADPDSLILFDELGAGTDPTEGAALAASILKDLRSRGIRTMATTHYSELKVFALRTDRVINGSCEFDVETLSPTYRLLIGLPGKSNAFAISRKLGLSEAIIENARAEISDQEESFEDLIASLEISRRKIEEEKRQIEESRQEIDSLRKDLKAQKDKLAEKREKLMAQSSEEASRILQKAKEYADQTIRYYNKHGGSASARELEERRTNLRKKIDNLDQRASVSVKAPGKDKAGKKGFASGGGERVLKASDLKIGDDIFVKTLGLKGTVSTLPDARGQLYVTMGVLRSKVTLSDLEKIDEPDAGTSSFGKSGGGSIKVTKSMAVSPEINLLGMTVDEAVAELDKYLDDACLAHLNQVRIVHGKGTGALRSGIHNYLRKQKRIKSYRLGEFGEGDTGVTIVEFR